MSTNAEAFAGAQAVDCIMPAAGLSERMGSWKPLVPYPDSGGRPLVEVSVERALEVCSRVILVSGYRGGELEDLFSGATGVLCVRNGEFRRGMFSSIQAGAARVEAPLFFIAHADMPEIPAELYRLLLERMVSRGSAAADAKGSAGNEPDMVRPLYRGRPGHPVLCRRPVASSILAEAPESNMQHVMKHHRVLEIDVDWPGCIYDVDRPEDL